MMFHYPMQPTDLFGRMPDLRSGDWQAQLKIDGYRGVFYTDEDGCPHVSSKKGNSWDNWEGLKEIKEFLGTLPFDFDTEVITKNLEIDRFDKGFNKGLKRGHEKYRPYIFVLDIFEEKRTQEDRWKMIEELDDEFAAFPGEVCFVDRRVMWSIEDVNGFLKYAFGLHIACDGIVLKNMHSVYRFNPDYFLVTPDWIRIKNFLKRREEERYG